MEPSQSTDFEVHHHEIFELGRDEDAQFELVLEGVLVLQVLLVVHVLPQPPPDGLFFAMVLHSAQSLVEFLELFRVADKAQVQDLQFLVQEIEPVVLDPQVLLVF